MFYYIPLDFSPPSKLACFRLIILCFFKHQKTTPPTCASSGEHSSTPCLIPVSLTSCFAWYSVRHTPFSPKFHYRDAFESLALNSNIPYRTLNVDSCKHTRYSHVFSRLTTALSKTDEPTYKLPEITYSVYRLYLRIYIIAVFLL